MCERPAREVVSVGVGAVVVRSVRFRVSGGRGGLIGVKTSNV